MVSLSTWPTSFAVSLPSLPTSLTTVLTIQFLPTSYSFNEDAASTFVTISYDKIPEDLSITYNVTSFSGTAIGMKLITVN